MPGLRSDQLIDIIVSALTRAGRAPVVQSDPRSRPCQIAFTDHARGRVCAWFYVWTLTHGGGIARPSEEYRIQITGVERPLPLNPSGPTVLLGYHPREELFAGFDIRAHRTSTGQSPSIQIKLSCLREATRYGISICLRNNGEIAVGISPETLGDYVVLSEAVHSGEIQPSDLETIVALRDNEEYREDELLTSIADEPRRRVVAQVTRLSRSRRFRESVLRAYDRQCAVSGLQLGLVEAAHILPVTHPDSRDVPSNGIALSPTYHTAFDKGLIYLDIDNRMHIVERRIDDLKKENLVGGLEEFASRLQAEIFLPPNPSDRPDPEFVRLSKRIILGT